MSGLTDRFKLELSVAVAQAELKMMIPHKGRSERDTVADPGIY